MKRILILSGLFMVFCGALTSQTPYDTVNVYDPQNFTEWTAAIDTASVQAISRKAGLNRRINYNTLKKYFAPDVLLGWLGADLDSTGISATYYNQFVTDSQGDVWFVDMETGQGKRVLDYQQGKIDSISYYGDTLRIYEDDSATPFKAKITAGGIFTDIDTDYGDETVTSDWIFQGASATGGFAAYDLTIGNASDYGGLRIGNAGIYRSSAAPGAMDFGGAFILRQEANLDVGNDPGIEFAIMEQGNTVRFAIPESGAGNATAMFRSVTIAGPYAQASGNVQMTGDHWTTNDTNLDFDTGGTGADLFVQDDLEVGGTVFADIITEEIAASGVTIETVKAKDGWIGLSPLTSATSDGNEGELYADADDNNLFYHDGGGFEEVAFVSDITLATSEDSISITGGNTVQVGINELATSALANDSITFALDSRYQKVFETDMTSAEPSVTVLFTNPKTAGVYTFSFTDITGTQELIWPSNVKGLDEVSLGTVTYSGPFIKTCYYNGTNYICPPDYEPNIDFAADSITTTTLTVDLEYDYQKVVEIDMTSCTSVTLTVNNPVAGGVYTFHYWGVSGTDNVTWPAAFEDANGTALGTDALTAGTFYTCYYNPDRAKYYCK